MIPVALASTSALMEPSLPSLQQRPGGHGAADFQSVLQDARGADDPAEMRKAAEALVSTAFIMPLLRSAHQSPLRPTTGPFAAGAIEKRFMPLLDQSVADSVVKSAGLSLVEGVVAWLSQGRSPAGGTDELAA